MSLRRCPKAGVEGCGYRDEEGFEGSEGEGVIFVSMIG